MDCETVISATYRHSPLKDPAQQIRLLRYHRRPGEILTDFEIQVWPIDGCPAYHALSYCWGHSSETTNVILNQRILQVGVNAQYALLQAISLQTAAVSYYWLDAICIHQSDSYEKSHQVRMMGRIYSGASRVFNCVGPESRHSDLMFSVMQSHFPHRPYEVRDRHKHRIAQLQAYIDTLPPDSECINQLCTAVDTFLRGPYHERLWVLQEIMIAAEPGLVLCGLGTAPATFWQIHDLNGALISLGLLATDYMPPLRKIGHEIEHRVVVHGQPPPPSLRWSLPNLLALCQGFKCRDPRDHIYGVLSILQLPAGMPPIEVDYTLAAQQVFLHTLPYYLAEHGELVHKSLSILSKALGVELSQEQYLRLEGCHCLECAKRVLDATPVSVNCNIYGIFDTDNSSYERSTSGVSDHDCTCLENCPSAWSPKTGILQDELRVLLLQHGCLANPPAWSGDLSLPDDPERKCFCQI